MNRMLSTMPPYRWWRVMRALIRCCRVHPSAVLFGQESQVALGLGCVLGANVRVDPGKKGRVKIGDRCWIAGDVEVQTETQVIFGEGVSVQRRSTINGSTRLGRGCILAPNVFISSGTHPFRFIPHLPIREQERRMTNNKIELSALDQPVWVQDDCWLGANVVVCPGVTIGKGSVVGANTVVTKDVPPYSVVVGSPGRKIGSRLNWCPPAQIDPSREEDWPYLLDARIQTDSLGSYIQVDEEAPLHAALMELVNSGKLQINWRALKPVSLIIGKSKIKLQPGEGLLEIESRDFEIKNSVTQCAISLVPDSVDGAKFDIIKLGWKQ